MYVKINWDKQTVNFVNDAEANENIHPLFYEIREEYFPGFVFETFDSVEEIYAVLMNDEHLEDTIVSVLEDDNFCEMYDLLDLEWKEMIDICKQNKEWIQSYLVGHHKDFVVPLYEEFNHIEYIKVP